MLLSIKNFLKSDLLIIFFLGFSSGLPLALVLSTLKVFLVDLNVDIKTIGLFSLIALPYSLKFLWAPIVDSIELPLLKKLGRRRSWIILNQVLLIIFIAMLGIFDAANVSIIAAIAVVVATVSATQDMAIDAYRIEKIKPENQGIAATIYVYGYRIGMLISGAVALVLSQKIAWSQVYYVLAAVMLIGVVTTLLAKEDLVVKIPHPGNFIDWVKESAIKPIAEFVHRQNWYLILPFVILFKLCDAFAGSLTLPFLLEIGFSKMEIAAIVKTFGLFATLAGALFGGILVKKIGLMKSLWIAAILQMLSNLAFSYQAALGYNTHALYLVIFVENFSGGIGDAVFVAYLSSLCNVAFTATQYAVLVSFATVARSLLSSFAGVAAASLGWINFFFFSALLALPALILLFLLSRKFKASN
jgi:PAT family beta-lactamase induction signal transducer AmpG